MSSGHECITQASRATVLEGIDALASLTESVMGRRERLANLVGLSDQQWRVLEEIASEHFMPSLFARQRESTPSAVSRLIRQLRDKGLIIARVDNDDARQRRYRLSAKGQGVMDALREGRERAIRAVWAAFAEDELQRFTDIARSLSAKMDAYSDMNQGKG